MMMVFSYLGTFHLRVNKFLLWSINSGTYVRPTSARKSSPLWQAVFESDTCTFIHNDRILHAPHARACFHFFAVGPLVYRISVNTPA